MSKPFVDSDGFQLISTKKGRNSKQTKIPKKNNFVEKQEVILNIEKAKRNILAAVGDLDSSVYLDSVFKAVSTKLKSKSDIDIVCFGLGHIGECIISRFQLGLLLCFKNRFHIKKILVYDPIFYKSECEILKEFDIQIIENNHEGHYVIPDDCFTILYLPHTPKQLTNNFLWSNWGKNLENCILISNSFSSLIDNQLDRILIDTVPYIYKIYPYTEEIILPNNFKYSDIFNDISIHTFPKENLSRLDIQFWNKCEKPEYEDDEEFISSLMTDKLRI